MKNVNAIACMIARMIVWIAAKWKQTYMKKMIHGRGECESRGRLQLSLGPTPITCWLLKTKFMRKSKGIGLVCFVCPLKTLCCLGRCVNLVVIVMAPCKIISVAKLCFASYEVSARTLAARMDACGGPPYIIHAPVLDLDAGAGCVCVVSSRAWREHRLYATSNFIDYVFPGQALWPGSLCQCPV